MGATGDRGLGVLVSMRSSTMGGGASRLGTCSASRGGSQPAADARAIPFARRVALPERCLWRLMCRHGGAVTDVNERAFSVPGATVI
jgi:hypothetical protein